MTEAAFPHTENVKVLRSEERAGVSKPVITSADAVRSGLPENCVVMPMRILEDPEPIKHTRN